MEKVPIHLARPSHRPGFTLVELAMVVAVTAIVAAIAVPRYTNATVRYRLETASRRISADIDAVQQEAVATSSTRGFVFSAQGYSIWKIDGLGNKVVTQTVKLGDPPYSITSLAAAVDGDTNKMLQFDGYGKPNGTATVVVKIGGEGRNLTSSAVTGKVAVN